MASRKVLIGLMRAAKQNGATSLKSVSEMEPELLAKARRLALAVGTAAGAFGSLVGVGGGVLIGPVILNTCPSIPQRVISGTSLAAVATTGATAGAVYWSSDCVEVRTAALLAAAAVVTAPFGAKLTHKVDCQRLRQLLGYWLYFVAPLVPLKAVVFSKQKDQHHTGHQQAHDDVTSPHNTSAAPGDLQPEHLSGAAAAAALSHTQADAAHVTSSGRDSRALTSTSFSSRILFELQQPFSTQDAALVATGGLAGLASGLLGIGGGTVVTPMLALVTGAPQQVVLGTSLAAMVVPSLVGLAQHQKLGNVDWRMAAALAVGTTVGSYLGSNLAIQAPAGVLEGLFAAGMLLLGRRTLVTATKGVPRAAQ